MRECKCVRVCARVSVCIWMNVCGYMRSLRWCWHMLISVGINLFWCMYNCAYAFVSICVCVSMRDEYIVMYMRIYMHVAYSKDIHCLEIMYIRISITFYHVHIRNHIKLSYIIWVDIISLNISTCKNFYSFLSWIKSLYAIITQVLFWSKWWTPLK